MDFRDLVNQAPVGITILKGRSFIAELANETYLQIVGKKEHEFVGKPLFESLPEVQSVVHPLLTKVLDTGIPFYANELEVTLHRFERSDKAWFNLAYQPLRESSGEISGIIVVATEVTYLVRTRHLVEQREAQFSDNAERLRLATEGTQLATWDLDLKTRQIIHSPRLAVIFGYDDERKLSHAEMRTIIHPEDLGVVEKAFDEAMKSGIYLYEARVVHPDKTNRWIRTRGKVIFDSAQMPLRMVGTLVDITDQKSARQQVEESEQRLQIVVEASGLGTWELDLKTDKVVLSDRYLEIFGYGKNTSDHQPFIARIHPDYLNVRNEAFENALKTGELYYETAIVWEDKSVHWIEAKGKLIRDQDGRPAKMTGTLRDITQQKTYYQEIQASEQKFRTLADSMPQFIWTGDDKGVLNYFNASVYNYSGLTREQIATDGWLQIVHPDEQVQNIALWLDAIATGNDFVFEHRFRRADGVYRWQLSRAIPQRADDGKILMWVGTSTDIHDKKVFMDELEHQVEQRTRELKISNDELRKSNNELEQFAYVASHDLQEPLRKIQTFATRIMEVENDNLSPKGKDYMSRMQGSSRRMQQLILDLLAFSRASTGEKHFEKIDLNLLLEKVKDQLSDAIERNHVSIRPAILPDLSIIPFQFEQLFSNIIGNAIKFARKGVAPVIEITSGSSEGKLTGNPDADPEKIYQFISFQDNGIGFDQQFAARIFQVFQRLHGKDVYDGTGIGLAICKKIAENHGGFIMATGTPGAGSKFTIYL